MPRFFVTFEVVTFESAEHGEPDKAGFIAEGCGLREALDLVSGYAPDANVSPVPRENPPRWFTHHEYAIDYRTGARESRSLHLPDNCTPASALRVARLLGAA
jgi:hypothetical protein